VREKKITPIICKPIEMLGLDNIRKTRCVLIYPINKMYAIPEKKTGINLRLRD
jgi:hypothetical protein